MAPFTLPEETPTSRGIARVLLKKAFFDSVAAVKACEGVPPDDLSRVVRGMLAPELIPSFAEAIGKMDQLDKAQLAVCLSFAFHSGYSLCLADVEAKRNIHVEYVNEQRAANGTAGANNSQSP